MVDGTKIADIVIPAQVKGAVNGFYNAEYPIPDVLLKDENGQVKTRFTVRLAATAGTLNPGLYYLRLVSGYNVSANAYQFHASDWTTGDAWRIPASNITYDEERNVIMARSVGDNNIALTLKYQEHDYDIEASQTYLVVCGKGLKTTQGASYLWWLNGTNRGSQVVPAFQDKVIINGEERDLVAWNMSTSGLYDNFTGDRPNVCMGMTIFGLTSSNEDGSCEIFDINFAKSVDDYISSTTTGIMRVSQPQHARTYTLGGMQVENAQSAVRKVLIENGKKVVK